MTAKWRTAPVNGDWRLENSYHGHRLSVRRNAPRLYRAYLNGRMLGLWRSKEPAIAPADAESAALARESRKPAVFVHQTKRLKAGGAEMK